MEQKSTESAITKLARFIVDKRKAFYLVFIAAVLFSAASISKVQVNNDITSYLPPETETRRGLTIMEEEFITLGSANVMVSNVSYDTAQELTDQIAAVPGVSQVVFDDRMVEYETSEMEELVLAYAISIHKSQGSEYPAVVIPLFMQHFIMLQRNLVYTAVTRGKKLVVLVGEKRALERAVANADVKRRYTRLTFRLREYVSNLYA